MRVPVLSSRVLKPGGHVLILDKFVDQGETAWLRRALNLLSQHIATRLDVIFEEVLEGVPGLKWERDLPVLAGGWLVVYWLGQKRSGRMPE